MKTPHQQAMSLVSRLVKNSPCSRHMPLSGGIPYSRQDFEPMEWMGRVLRADKRGEIDESQAPILKRLGIDEENWVESVTRFSTIFMMWQGR